MRTAIYLRLSRDDGNDAESNSIKNQRDLLRKYALDNELGQVEEFIDDGISGTTFERPGFKRMCDAIEAGSINVVVCKDLSRFGRNNAMVSYYTELYFPEKSVRFIAVLDNIDSDKGDDIVMPFRSVINDYYARDVSRKCRSVKRSISLKGGHTGSKAPYGYVKDTPTTMIVDPAQAVVVREIFRLLSEGTPVLSIAKSLTAAGIPTPAGEIKAWSFCSVRNILRHRAYIGEVVGQRYTTRSFKIKKYIERPESEWIIIPGMHEAIVTTEQWEIAQNHFKNQKHVGRPRKETSSIFVGAMICHECGKRLVRKMQRNMYYFMCQGLNCTTHYIREDKLEEVVLREVNKQIKEFDENSYKRDNRAIQRMRKALDKYERRENEIREIIKRIIEKNTLGVLEDGMYEEMMQEYQQERITVENGINATRAELASDPKMNAMAFAKLLGRFTKMPILRKDALVLIEKIVVSEAKRMHMRKGREQMIEIYWKHIGLLDDGVMVGDDFDGEFESDE
ncbi:recombinase [Clostridia bacterium]|nr:recombinase [Clostridia bacterium]